jgi:hypothetical protein
MEAMEYLSPARVEPAMPLFASSHEETDHDPEIT